MLAQCVWLWSQVPVAGPRPHWQAEDASGEELGEPHMEPQPGLRQRGCHGAGWPQSGTDRMGPWETRNQRVPWGRPPQLRPWSVLVQDDCVYRYEADVSLLQCTLQLKQSFHWGLFCEDRGLFVQGTLCEDRGLFVQGTLCEDRGLFVQGTLCEDRGLFVQGTLCEDRGLFAQRTLCEDRGLFAQRTFCEDRGLCVRTEGFVWGQRTFCARTEDFLHLVRCLECTWICAIQIPFWLTDSLRTSSGCHGKDSPGLRQLVS